MVIRIDPANILISLTLFGMAGRHPAVTGISSAGLTDIAGYLQELTDVMQGIHSFLSGFSFISQTIGFGTILLFLAVIIFSAGYAAIGVPKGKSSLFFSLATADALWIFWKMSFNTPFSAYMFPMIKANLVLLFPIVIVAIVSRAAPAMFIKLRALAPFLLRRKRALVGGEAAVLCNECQDRSAQLTRSLIEDILASGGAGSPVRLSAKTRKHAQSLRETLGKIDH